MIIPKPKKYTEKGEITIAPHISSVPELRFCEKAFKRMFKKLHSVNLSEGEDGFLLKLDATLAEEEYRISGREIFAATHVGARNALSSMLQLVEIKDGKIFLKDTEISDKPCKEYRAMMVDLARQWHDFSIVLGYVDICYLNKIKYLQIHFSDDQSSTLPLKSFPNAATVGRSYTHTEIEYLVEYANEASVELIPEFEGIGHSMELIKNCPEFGNEYVLLTPEQVKEHELDAREDGTIIDNIMCIGKEDIFDNIKTILTEMAETFKYSRYIHVGCDEALHWKWDFCPKCQEYMKKNGIENTAKLYSHFASKIVDICKEVGRKPIVWEGFPKEGNDLISKDATVVSWENTYQPAADLLEGGFNIINAAWKPLYIVERRPWSLIEEDFNVYRWDSHMPHSAAYNGLQFEPTDRIIGAMLCQWECNYDEECDRIRIDLPVLGDRTWNASDYYTKDEFMSLYPQIKEMEEKLY